MDSADWLQAPRTRRLAVLQSGLYSTGSPRVILKDAGTDDGTVSVGRRAAVVCQVVMLHGKLASKNAQL